MGRSLYPLHLKSYVEMKFMKRNKAVVGFFFQLELYNILLYSVVNCKFLINTVLGEIYISTIPGVARDSLNGSVLENLKAYIK